MYIVFTLLVSLSVRRIYIYTYVYTCMYTHIGVIIYIENIYLSVYLCICLSIEFYIYIYIYIYIYLYITKKNYNRFTKLNLWSATDLKFLMFLKGNLLQKYTVMTISCHDIVFDISVLSSSFYLAFTRILGDSWISLLL